MIPLNEYQQIIFNLLKKKITDVKVYDDVPKNAKLPLIILGDYILSNGLTKMTSYKINQSIEIYSNYEGKKQINELVSQIISAISEIFNTDINEDWYVCSLVLLESNVSRLEEFYSANLKFEIEVEKKY